MPVIRLAQRSVPGLVLHVVNASRVRGRRQVRCRESAGDELLEKQMRVPAVRDARKPPVLPRQAHARVLEDEHQTARLPRRETSGLHAGIPSDHGYPSARSVLTDSLLSVIGEPPYGPGVRFVGSHQLLVACDNAVLGFESRHRRLEKSVPLIGAQQQRAIGERQHSCVRHVGTGATYRRVEGDMFSVPD
jgi:hypothetical protein